MAEPAGLRVHARVCRRLVGGRIRSDWQYRTSFATFAASQALIVSLELVAVLLVLRLVPTLGGWTTAEVVFLYGLSATCFALADVSLSAVERVAAYVRSGDLDRLLLRPTPVMLQLVSLEFELRRVGKLVPGVCALGWSLGAVDVAWGLDRVGLLLGFIVSGSVVYSGLWVLSAATSFWLVDSAEATYAFTYGGQFSNQFPSHVYPGWLRAVLGWAIPLGFVSYIPSIALLGAPNPLGLPGWFVGLPFAVAPVTWLAALAVWSAGLRRYQSTGS